MSKFNTTATRLAVHGSIRTDATATGTTFEGGPGFARDAKSELFLLAVANMVGENTFYESAGNRDNRFAALVRQIAVEDFDWLTRFAHWLRTDANMRSAPIVLAAEAAKARLDAGESGGRDIIKAVLQRADEPGEMLSYWHANYGRKLPKPVKRGIADAARRLYGERSYLKWDSDARGIRFADVIQLTHPDPDGAQVIEDLYHYVIGRRLGVEDLAIPETLPTLRANVAFKQYTGTDIDRMAADGSLSGALADAGMTWEALSSFGAWTAARWEAMIPSMGYMALLRNLRNFDQAGVSDKVAMTVAARLSDPEQVAKSKQLPMRFLSAYRAAPSLRWAYPLEQALDLSLSNIPELRGRTLILIDTSGSMNSAFSKDGMLMRWDAATVFGLALARRCQNADVVSFSNRAMRFDLQAGESLLKSVERWKVGGYFLNGGTQTAAATQAAFERHDRVVILTDEQASAYSWGGDPGAVIPKTVPLYTWNLAGYKMGHAAGGPLRHTFGGLSDQCFGMVELLERGRDADWPF
jgi:hypothetical protein